MDLTQRMILFADIVERGNISAAAKSRGMTRSAISKQLAKLEDETGVRLLNRNTRTMSLTAPGQMVYDQALNLRAGDQEARALVANIGQQVCGELRISTSFHFGRFYLCDVVTAFTEHHPEVIPNLQLTDQQVDIIQNNIDLAVRIGGLKDSGLISRKLFDNNVVMVASPKFLARQGMPSDISQLMNHPCIVYDNGEFVLDQWNYINGESVNSIAVRAAFKSGDGQILLDACKASIGIALLPTYVAAHSLATGALEQVLPEVKMQNFQSIYMIYASRKYMPPVLSEFIDFLLRWSKTHPAG